MEILKKIGPALLGCVFALSWLLIVLLTSVEWTAFDRNFYADQYQKGGQAASIGISEEALMEVTDGLLEYLRGERVALDMQAEIMGEVRPVFNERECAHMVDVQVLFVNGFRLRWIALAVAAGSLAALIALRRKKAIPILGRCCFWATVALGALLAALGIALAIDFNGVFTQFHLLFFNNDLWILDPRTDILIQMVPQAFFVATATRIVITLAIGLVVTAALGFWAMRAKVFRKEVK